MREAIILAALLSVVCSADVGKLPEEDLPVPELIKYWGYPVEVHEALTDDGYFLTLHRIPHGKVNSAAPPENKREARPPENNGKIRPVMLLVHGLLCSSSNWLTNLPNESLGYILADAGYDVWLGNVRGNTYSKKHKTLSVKSSAFWDFSFDEMAKYDLPAMIDYVLQNTTQAQLYYVGHSQGTLIAFAGLSENIELQKKIKIFFALAPVTRLRYIYSPIKIFAPFETELKLVFEGLNIHQFLPSLSVLKFFGDIVCPLDEDICSVVLSLIAGYDKKNLNESRIPVYVSHSPAGTSVKNMYHFAALITSKVFQKYDYGWWNIIKYHSFHPPIYHFETIKTPMVLFSGSEDWLAAPRDVKWTSQQIQNLKGNIEIKGYNHLDFIWGMSAAKEVYQKIIKMVELSRYEKYRKRIALL